MIDEDPRHTQGDAVAEERIATNHAVAIEQGLNGLFFTEAEDVLLV